MDAERGGIGRARLKAALSAAGAAPRKRHGQHFLLDENLLAAIVRDAGVQADEQVLEVGPGPGLLTRHLLAAGAQVTALEIDRAMRAVAGQLMEADLWPRVTWIEADAMAGGRRLSEPMQQALRGADRLVANLPYNVSAPLLAAAVLQTAREGRGPAGFRVRGFTVLVQREMGQRMAAAPGSPDYGPLAVLLQLAGRVRLLRKVPPGAFWPAPKVDSVVVDVAPWGASGPDLAAQPGLEAFLAGAFAQRRKTLVNSLAGTLGGTASEAAQRLGLEENRRTWRAEAFHALELYDLAAHWAQPTPGERTRHDP